MVEIRRFIRGPEAGDVRYDWFIFGVYILPGSLSMIGSILVILTYILFKKLRRKRYLELMVYVSVNNFFFALGGALGPVPTYSLACWYQGIMTNVGYVSAALWIVVITALLWRTVRFTPPPRGMFWTHLFIWTTPLLFSLLPLSTNTYGNPGGNSDTSWCFVVTTTDDDPSETSKGEVTHSQLVSEAVWVWFSFYVWVVGAIIVMCGLTMNILWKLQTDSERTRAIRKQVYGLLLYPLIFTVTSLPSAIIDTTTSIGSDDDEELRKHGFDAKSAFSICLFLLSGFLLSLAFFYVNVHVRVEWWQLYERLVLGREAETTPSRKIVGAGGACQAMSVRSLVGTDRAQEEETGRGRGRGRESGGVEGGVEGGGGGGGGERGRPTDEPSQYAEGVGDHIPTPMPLPLPHTHNSESDPEHEHEHEHNDDPLEFLEDQLRRGADQYPVEIERNEALHRRHSDERTGTSTSTATGNGTSTSTNTSTSTGLRVGQGVAKPKRGSTIELDDVYDRRSIVSSSDAAVGNPLSAAAPRL